MCGCDEMYDVLMDQNDQAGNTSLRLNDSSQQTQHNTNCAGLMLAQRLRRCPNIEPAHAQCVVFAATFGKDLFPTYLIWQAELVTSRFMATYIVPLDIKGCI